MVRSTAAAVACEGVADTVFPGGNMMDALSVSTAAVVSGVMVVTVFRGAVTCLMAVDRS